MMSLRVFADRPAWLLVLAGALSCAPPALAPLAKVALSAPRPGVPWPEGVPPCTLPATSGESMCAGGYAVFASREATAEIAIVERPSAMQATWSALPLVGALRRAKVELRGRGLRLTGWADLEGREFSLRRRVDIVKDHLWAPPQTPVEIVGTSGARVVVAVRTPFQQPEQMEAWTTCDNLIRSTDSEEPAREAAPEGVAVARAEAGRVDLRSAPGGPVLLSFEVSPDWQGIAWLEQSGGHARIAGGRTVWTGHAEDATILFDGWASIEQVKKSPKREPDRDSGCHPLDDVDSCPVPRALREATFSVGVAPGGAASGVLERGAELVLGERRWPHVAFEVPGKVVVAPKGKRFWMLEEDVDRGCGAPESAALEDGCPACD
jgi:hypothetical protein